MSDALLEILEKLELPEDELPEVIARYLLDVRLSDAEQARYLALAERHNNGELAPAELETLQAFVDADSLLSLLKAKARRSLAEHQPAA